jgi:hypothetical protein
MLGLGFITLLILNAGYKMLEDQEIRKRETEKSDEAQQILEALAKGYEFAFHLSLADRKQKDKLKKALINDKAATVTSPHLQIRRNRIQGDSHPDVCRHCGFYTTKIAPTGHRGCDNT